MSNVALLWQRDGCERHALGSPHPGRRITQEANQGLCFSAGKAGKEDKPEVCPCEGA